MSGSGNPANGGDEGLLPVTYEEAKELARHDDPKVRVSLASREDVRAEILYFLAEDPSPEVRREIAANKATPPQANLVLASDADEEVRGGLAAKIARLAPELSDAERDRLSHLAREALEILARDQVIRCLFVLFPENRSR